MLLSAGRGKSWLQGLPVLGRSVSRNKWSPSVSSRQHSPAKNARTLEGERFASAGSRWAGNAGAPMAGKVTPVMPGRAGMAEEPAGMDTEAMLLEGLAEIPTISRAWCMPSAIGGCDIQVLFSQRDFASNTLRKFMSTVHVPVSVIMGAAPCMVPALPWQLRPDVVATAPSPSGRHMLVVRGGSTKDPTILEIWGGGRLMRELEVPATIHGAVYNDGWFSDGAAWSPDETRVAYVAEAPRREQTPEWGKKVPASSTAAAGDSSKEPRAGPKGWRGKGPWQEDWGECYAGKPDPRLFVLDLANYDVRAVEGIPADLSVGQPLWAPNGEHLVFVGWKHSPENLPQTHKRLGIVYCLNRPCSIYAVHCPPGTAGDGGAVDLTPGCMSAHSPRFTPDGSIVVFLSHEQACTTGVHASTGALRWMPWSDGKGCAGPDFCAKAEERTMISVVHPPGTSSEFPGLYATSLPSSPFLADGHTIVINMLWRSDLVIVEVNTMTGEVTRITPPGPGSGSWKLHDLQHDVIVASMSAHGVPDRLMVARKAHGTWIWEPISVATPEPYRPEVEAALADMEYQILQVPYSRADGGAAGEEVGEGDDATEATFEAIVLRSRNAGSGPQPAVLCPHGGPHAAFTTAFTMPYAFLTSQGYTAVLVNFRGSLGFGEDSVQSLPGKIGDQDVRDCLAALDVAVEAGLVDPARVAVQGGSHGGFLTGHLIGQHPEKFKCAAMRNPVCNLGLMVGTSDIPEWCYVEALGSEAGMKRFRANPSPEDLEVFRAKSPITTVDNVNLPLLVLLGAKDARVPFTDAKQYVTALKDRGESAPDVRVLVFPEDKHALDKPQTEFESWMNILAWLKKYNPASTP
ncbi:unnamed protein product [Pedinophyceae sp. YPF-701]|nr:unnamed protein product [Pedinophyceae sp. YPF-701]